MIRHMPGPFLFQRRWKLPSRLLATFLAVAFASIASEQSKPETVPGATAPANVPGTYSHIKIYDLKTRTSREIYSSNGFYEGPYYSRDGKYLFFEGGPDQQLYRIPVSGGKPEIVDIGQVRIKHDHGFSPDGKWLAMNFAGGTQVFLSTATGADRHTITPKDQLFYFHVWSPDSQWIIGGSRKPDTSYGIYRIKPDGSGEESLMQLGDVANDVPDFTADGKWIYFNSDRTGSFQIWRMPADGAGPGDKLAREITTDKTQNWWPHPSPDGKWLVFASYEPNVRVDAPMAQWIKNHPGETISHYNLTNHPYNQNVVLRLRSLPGNDVRPAPSKLLAHIIGGQGSININSWSPDSQHFAYVSYEAKP